MSILIVLSFRLTPDDPKATPGSLRLVHLRVRVSGVSYSRQVEAEHGLTHVYAWNKRNVYNQKVQ